MRYFLLFLLLLVSGCASVPKHWDESIKACRTFCNAVRGRTYTDLVVERGDDIFCVCEKRERTFRDR